MEENTLNTKKYTWTTGTVKNRMHQIIESLENNVKIDISEEEIRSLQQFSNEKSTPFLKAIIKEQKQKMAKKRHRMIYLPTLFPDEEESR